MNDTVVKAKELADSLPKPETKEDWASNGDAAELFCGEVDWEHQSAADVCGVHNALYMKVGHKRLGRIWAKIGKSL